MSNFASFLLDYNNPNNKKKATRKIVKSHKGQRNNKPNVGSPLFTLKYEAPISHAPISPNSVTTIHQILEQVPERRNHRTTSRYVRGGRKKKSRITRKIASKRE